MSREDDFGLTEEIKKLNTQMERMNRRLSIGYGFLHGIFAGLGTTIGVAIILGVAAFLLQKVVAPYLPGTRDNINEILRSIENFKQGGR